MALRPTLKVKPVIGLFHYFCSMRLLIVCNEEKINRLWNKELPFEGCSISFTKEPTAELLQNNEAIIDLSLEQMLEHIALYKTCSKPVLIASVINTLHDLQVKDEPIARFNNWPGMSERTKLELAVNSPSASTFEQLLNNWQIDYEATADVPGFVSARIIAMIINEAYLALGEDVSTIAEINTAMKLGTNYPNGPFEWCELIGASNVVALLEKLSQQNERYSPAPLLKQKANEQ
jgi:3-hydroxybutyryl-CoA dehydrogenase